MKQVSSKCKSLIYFVMMGAGLLFNFPVNAQTFTNLSISQNIYASTPLYFGSGASFYDFDNDGWDDLSFAVEADSLIFYKNNQGLFELIPSYVPSGALSRQQVWVDYDNDGDLDIFVSNYLAPYKLFNNDGNFNFTDVSVEAGLPQVFEKHFGVSFADYNRDGYLDFYLCLYEFEGDETYFNRLNHLFKNNGDGTFTDVTLEAGVGNGIQMSFQGVWFDYDMDGWQDLFVINDRFHPNVFYKNNGDGTFTDVTDETGTALPLDDPMSATIGDYDNDGDLDIYMSNSTNLAGLRCRLLRNNNDGTFTDVASILGVDFALWTWGALWVDVNNDTFQDLYVAYSEPLGLPGSNLFRISSEATIFNNAATLLIGNTIGRSYSPVRGDIDNDGYYDMAVHNAVPDQPFVWKNSGGSQNSIKITLQGTVSNSFAIGSWIRVFAGGQQYTQYTLCGENYLGQNSQHHIFGLADYEIIDSVEVEYVSGHKDKYYDLQVNQDYLFVEGETYTASIVSLGTTELCEGDSVILDAGAHNSYLWNNGHTERYLTVSEPNTYCFTAFSDQNLQALSDTVLIVVNPLPIINYISQNPFCANDSSGSITLENTSGIITEEVIWNTGDSGMELLNKPSGSYSYTLTDINGCTSSGSVDLVEPVALDVQYFISPEVNGNDGSIFLIINGGVAPYTIMLDSSMVGLVIENLTGGIYSLLVKDVNNCEFSVEIEIESTVGIDFQSDEFSEINIFPNPTNGGFEISSIEKIDRIDLYSLNGDILLHLQKPTEQFIDIRNFSSGMYIIEISTRTGNKIYKKLLKY